MVNCRLPNVENQSMSRPRCSSYIQALNGLDATITTVSPERTRERGGLQ